MAYQLSDFPPHVQKQIREREGTSSPRKPPPQPKKLSAIEEAFALHLRLDDVEAPVREYRFAPPRKWRIDFAWPARKFAVEIEGLTHDGGRHQRLKGFEDDLEKYTQAMLDGWTIYRTSQIGVNSGRALEVTKLMLARLPASPRVGA